MKSLNWQPFLHLRVQVGLMQFACKRSAEDTLMCVLYTHLEETVICKDIFPGLLSLNAASHSLFQAHSAGAPQGTEISAALLFSIYTGNQRVSDNKHMAVKFADDTTLIKSSNSAASFGAMLVDVLAGKHIPLRHKRITQHAY